MDNVFVKEVINGKLVVIRQLKVSDLLKIGIMGITDESLKLTTIFSFVLTVNGEKLSPQDILNSEDISLFSFVSESVRRMTDNLNLF
ncbi:hypothetical protein [Flavobacterium phage FCOV-F14]|uniref:Uncharacterized protein n=8 Tax=Ficleduovirus FCL2 TaxID=2560473 RepID=A0A0A0YQA1_9CAUD|nr:hypothetical protein ABG42_gp43 [Flavobacterium phage FCL-2]QCW21154.1 hypothetical protein [Flavobacterium phage FCOV-F13]QCW21228.1 hypothetical protein [Flavobacterium phage FCOV-F16]QCW21530.1 hypothetical protein [Flavobacterium phage FCOV-F45]QCW21604.1 hypothetical protein [Flavobacterium phage FCOV-F46]QCW21678.1 hypothetical protein [Flavobacterium phage FCOV-F54]QNJ51700.1 hypothetical protein [Flavobacterium phage FCOV-F14]QNJ51774.1 hypothetical protein [Flavobacterium phage F